MSRLGTCTHAHRVTKLWRSVPRTQPHQKAWVEVKDHNEYTCQHLDQYPHLPPPIMRMNGGFSIRETDCDVCLCYAPKVLVKPKKDAPRG